MKELQEMEKQMVETNPFNPAFGKIPHVYVERQELQNKVVAGIRANDGPYQTTMVYGPRGSGKTAFLTEVCNEIGNNKNWIVVNLIPDDDMIPVLVQSMYRKAEDSLKTELNALSGFQISVFGGGFGFTKGQSEHVKSQILLEEVMEKLRKRKVSVLVAIDEVTASDAMRKFAAMYQILIREGYDISLIMSGLPVHVSSLMNDKTLTFLLRSARAELYPLGMLAMSESYQKVFSEGGRTGSQELFDRMAKMTSGYAYAFQLLGYLVWETGAKEIDRRTLESVLDTYKSALYVNSYTKIMQELSPVDRAFLYAMADSGADPASIGVVGETLQKPKNYLSRYRQRLLEGHLISAVGRGLVSFSLPYFGEFTKRYRDLYEE